MITSTSNLICRLPGNVTPNQVVATHNLLKKSLLILKCLRTIDHVVRIKLLARRTRSKISLKKSSNGPKRKTTTTLLFYSKCNLWSGIQVTFCYYSESDKSYTQCNHRAVTHVTHMCQLLLKGKLCNIFTMYSWACELLWCLKGVCSSPINHNLVFILHRVFFIGDDYTNVRFITGCIPR